ncbi:hypothetical protein D049_1030B, partial [Vibrio parahaemolyticus VPTS-2010]
TTQYHL